MILPRLVSAAHSLRASTEAFSAFLSVLPESAVTLAPPQGWSPAAHGFHVALTNELFVGVIAGTAPLTVSDDPSDFPEDVWSFAAAPAAATPRILVPPSGVSRADTLERMAGAAARLEGAMETLDTARGALAVQLPWGRVTLVQMCEWSAGHTMKHLSQVVSELQQSAARAFAV